MSAQASSGRREAAIAAAAKLGPMSDDVAEAIVEQRARYAEKRAARAAPVEPIDRRASKDRRSGEERRALPAYPATPEQEKRRERNRFAEKPSSFLDVDSDK